jgi:Ca2+:H+ antiporter
MPTVFIRPGRLFDPGPPPHNPALGLPRPLLGAPLDLVSTPLELISLRAGVVVAGFIALDGESHWLEGAMLCGVYLIAALTFFFTP